MASNERQTFKAENIFAALSHLGICGEAPCLDGEFRGGQCHVFKVNVRDAASLAVRVPLYMDNAGGRDAKIEALQTELRNLQALEAKGFPWSPRCRGQSLTFDNAVEHPFLVLSWFDGAQLSWSEDSPPRPVRDRVLGQMASIQLALIECTLENGSTATAYFERLAGNRRTRVEEGRIPGLSLQDCADQRALLDAVLGADRDDTALAMDHGDFKPENVIIDAEYNIQGYTITDWAFAAPTPIPRAAGLPRFLWPSSLVSAPSLAVQRDREAYVASFAAQSSPAASYMRRWQAARDMDFCTLYLESLFSKGMHFRLARAGWGLRYRELAVKRDTRRLGNAPEKENRWVTETSSEG
ncbi:uncharacterized protein BDR25DRAFT_247028 [Lindgomyces ingoldianus]|uniref:Uncharacterized protein n=1 Tax=Lindgomyces ingoldianus TaxID=673940 RepID=A0ACB6Q7V0_9PLEO|nr:uncharacterized protein BDR25DRAFT_247028 [Lindgomyces ingoldianus]KAF2462932.1 hypothetical protein BDR25DRAFT_247028 [Lindgomyces ingoldianus]